jgi:hypothetical protein
MFSGLFLDASGKDRIVEEKGGAIRTTTVDPSSV